MPSILTLEEWLASPSTVGFVTIADELYCESQELGITGQELEEWELAQYSKYTQEVSDAEA